MMCPCQKTPINDSHQTVEESVLKSYEECCLPYHQHTILPQTAEQLMRSRYAAFVLADVDYIIATTLPAQQPFLDKNALLQWAEQTDWQGLRITKHAEKVGKNHAKVAFQAYFQTDTLQVHDELSAFVQSKNMITKDKQWYFLDPTLGIKIPQKQSCICASGEKFKRCCGRFL